MVINRSIMVKGERCIRCLIVALPTGGDLMNLMVDGIKDEDVNFGEISHRG